MPRGGYIIISIWILCIWNQSDAQSSCPELIVTRDILNKGFHRHVLTKLQIQGVSEQMSSCKIMFQESIPSGLFLDPDQLSSLHHHNLTEVLLLKAVDVEAPEYLSTGHSALVYAKPDSSCAQCFISTVPLHARYHRPSAGDFEGSSELQSPQLLIRCHKDFPPSGCLHYSVVKAPCGSESDRTCDWLNINYTAVPNIITLQIPVGIVQHGPFVCCVTLLVTLLCTGKLLITVYKHGHALI